VNRTCSDFQPLLVDRAAGALDDDGARRLDAHLVACLPCRTELAAVERALSLAALPPPSTEELQAVSAAAPMAATRWRTDHRERRFAGRLALAVAASAVFALAVPWILFARHATVPPPAAGSAATWKLPDLDAVWAVSSLADPGTQDEAAPELLFAELEEIDFDLE